MAQDLPPAVVRDLDGDEISVRPFVERRNGADLKVVEVLIDAEGFDPLSVYLTPEQSLHLAATLTLATAIQKGNLAQALSVAETGLRTAIEAEESLRKIKAAAGIPVNAAK